MFQAIIYSVKGIKQNLHVTGSSDCFSKYVVSNWFFFDFV